MTKRQRIMLTRILIAAALTIGLLFLPLEGTARLIAYLIPYAVIGYDILWSAVRGILNGRVFDENFLMAIATVGAFILAALKTQDYTEAVAVMLFYQIGELFQSYAVGKSRRNIASLMDIRPDYANIPIDGQLEEVDPDEVEVGSLIVVRPGEKIPIDGVVVKGTSVIDTAALTGESVPRDVTVNDEVISGCINLSGELTLRTTKEFADSTVSKILDLVENASSRKSRPEQFISKFAKVYTPVVCIAALLLAVVPPLVLLLIHQPFDVMDWIYRALTFLVISCPCALVISIPLTFFAGLGRASADGILIKGSNFFEPLSQAETVVFDKTGTLTEGRFSVTSCHAVDISETELLRFAAHSESRSTHPIAQSIVKAYGEAIDHRRIDRIQEIVGRGIEAVVDGKTVLCGNAALMDEQGIPCSTSAENGTIIHVTIDGQYSGCLVIADTVKPTSENAIAALKKSGVKKTVMLTGDNVATAQHIAQALQIDECFAELLPQDKVTKTESILADNPHGKVLFVGDGINDAPVLSRADVGVAMGALGSDAAVEAADVVLMNDDPMGLVQAIRIAKRAMRIVKQNIVFAIGVKLLCLLLGAFGIANLWLAIFADVGVMVIAVLNAVRMLVKTR